MFKQFPPKMNGELTPSHVHHTARSSAQPQPQPSSPVPSRLSDLSCLLSKEKLQGFSTCMEIRFLTILFLKVKWKEDLFSLGYISAASRYSAEILSPDHIQHLIVTVMVNFDCPLDLTEKYLRVHKAHLWV